MDPFESRFTKMATLGELPQGTPRVFRSAGSMVVLRRSDAVVEAVDGSCFADDRAVPSDERLQRILDCVATVSDSPSSDWDELVARAGLSVRIVDDDVWVCLEQC